MDGIQALERYCAFFETLTANDIERFDQIFAANARFKDPFHDVDELTQIQAIFAHMFRVTPDARFVIHDKFCHGHKAMITWTMLFTLKERPMRIEGSSYLVFDQEGLVILHRDYWDTGEELFSKLPYIGPLMQWLMKQFSALKQG